MMNRIYLLALLLHCLLTVPSFAHSPGEDAFLKLIDREDDATVIPLWPGDGTAPNQVGELPAETAEASPRTGKPAIRNVSLPSVIVVPPPADVTATGVTILFAPGGGYGNLSLSVASDMYQWASAIGAHCVVLKYRVPKAADDAGHRIPLSDAQRAVRLLRSKADELNIDENKIVMVGASAGGHLGFNLANNYGETTYQDVDDADKLSSKPDAAVLLYPAYLTNPIASLESDPHLHLDKLSSDRASPIFMAVTRPDKFTWGAVSAMMRLRVAKVPAELHVYPDGGHGGCFNKYPLMEFVRPASRFLKDRGIFTETMQSAGNQWLDELESSLLTRPASKEKTVAANQIPSSPESSWTPGDRALAALRDPAPTIIPLWPGDGTRDDDSGAQLQEELPDKGDGIVRVTKVSRPTLHHWRPRRPDGRAVIVFPGGAYNGLAAQHEGTEIAAWLNQQGITVFLAKYRVPRREGLEKHAVALQDAQRAIRLVRSRAGEFGIDPEQIGVLGFSAGGNLAALTVHKAATSSYDAIDAIDQTSAKPDFAILIYPAYLTKTRDGNEIDPMIAPLRSRNDYPPIYIAVAADDPHAPSSLHYILHLHQAKVPGELHVYASGGHGKGLRETGGPFAQWTGSCRRWLADLKHGTTKVLIE